LFATGQKVARSIPDEVIGLFRLPNPSSRSMALGFTQLLTNMRTRSRKLMFWGDKALLALRTDSPTAVYEKIV
jgi:hypothetical protein